LAVRQNFGVDRTPVANDADAAARQDRVVILVEDDESLREALMRVMRVSGLEVRAYGSAEALLSDRAQHSVDCLVVDLNLPALSGLDLVDVLRQCGVTAPAVAISARDEPQVREEVLRRGVERFLAKPFLGSTLVGTVNELLGSRHGSTDDE